MASARFHLAEGAVTRRVGDTGLPAASRGRVIDESKGNLDALGALGQQRLVLRHQIEVFGGEVLASTLVQHLAKVFGWLSPRPEPWLFDHLQALYRCGAISLDANGESDVIVRILPYGAEFAYDLSAERPVSHHPGAG